ncbi:hypothetical protein GH754_09655 [Salinibacillus xinjiangensis]|uniref:Endolytic transglycosylase MltG n=2 Tax=Salinibacillus xinjiangensis TaxID=1229268 RepID=A0A6G1X6R2_9BACI|nr:hypothetical protein [Salinibacillus xinjiangensis]
MDDDSTSQQALTVKEATTFLANEGYHTVEQQEWTKLNETLESQKQQQDKNDQQQSDKGNDENTEKDDKEIAEEKTNSEEPKTITIEVTPGMMINEISSKLAEEGIIDNETEFEQYLEENDYARLIQIGTFEIQSGMSHNEIAEVLTN